MYHKVFLPNYGVFDEKRYFEPGHRCPIMELGGVRIGMTMCEDCWFPSGPMAWQAHYGAEVLININGSPYHAGKRAPREAMVRERATDYGAFVAWVNTVGGQDELVFDGNSVVFDPHGEPLAHARSFGEEMLVCDIDIDIQVRRPSRADQPRSRGRGAPRPGRHGGRRRRARPRRRPQTPVAARIAEPLDGSGRDLRGGGARHPRLHPQGGLREGRDRAVRRRGLGADSGDRVRRGGASRT